jgi:prepilin-type N-terminal cleavage/methylation domain-containing protein
MSTHARLRMPVLNQRGMTVVEVMVAVVILGVGLAALSSAIPFAAYGIQEGNQLSTATFLANQRMEQVRNAQWTACPVWPAVTPVDNLGVSASATAAPQGDGGTTFPDETPLPAPYGGYSRQVRITNSAGPATCPGPDFILTGTAGRRQVTVTVSYRPMTGIGVAATGTTKSAVLTMDIAQR